MKNLLFVFSISLFISCQQPMPNTAQKELEELKIELKETQTALTKIKTNYKDLLIHTVYFNLKDELSTEDRKMVISEIKKLKAIEVVKNLQVGFFENLEDKRALSDYEVVMQMSFLNKEDYTTYQASEIHWALKENVGKYLSSPPATYDFITE